MRKYFCDRCGKEIDYESIREPFYSSTCDFCPECYEAFVSEVNKLIESFKNRGDEK